MLNQRLDRFSTLTCFDCCRANNSDLILHPDERKVSVESLNIFVFMQRLCYLQ